MTMVLSYKPSTNTTSGFLGFQTGSERPAVGTRLVPVLKEVSAQIINPILLPAITYGVWADELHHEHINIAARLRVVQEQTGLMNDYLRLQRTVGNVMNFDEVHRDLIL
jgi:hypothetical protein